MPAVVVDDRVADEEDTFFPVPALFTFPEVDLPVLTVVAVSVFPFVFAVFPVVAVLPVLDLPVLPVLDLPVLPIVVPESTVGDCVGKRVGEVVGDDVVGEVVGDEVVGELVGADVVGD